MRGFATSGGVVEPVLDRAARTGHKVSGGGGGGGGFCGAAFLRRSRATTRKVIDAARINADGSRPSNDSSRAEAIFTLAGRPAGLSSVCYASGTITASTPRLVHLHTAFLQQRKSPPSIVLLASVLQSASSALL